MPASIVKYLDFVRLAVGDVNETGNGAAQIEPRMQLDGSLGLAKRHPWIDRQAQVDGGGTERIHGRIQIHAKRFVGIGGAFCKPL